MKKSCFPEHHNIWKQLGERQGAYLEPCQTSMVEVFSKNSTVNFFRKKLQHNIWQSLKYASERHEAIDYSLQAWLLLLLTLSRRSSLSYRNCRAKQWTGFYMIGTSVKKRVNSRIHEKLVKDLYSMHLWNFNLFPEISFNCWSFNNCSW